jgi:hypothetical protein
MPTNYPTSLDVFVNPVSNDSLNSPSHSVQHANANDAIEAIEAKLGLGANVMPFAFSAGTVAVLTSGGAGGVTVTYPVGRFTQTPIVTVATDSPVFYDPFGMVTSPTSSSFIFRVRQTQTTAAATVVGYWTAIQMTSASASG